MSRVKDVAALWVISCGGSLAACIEVADACTASNNRSSRHPRISPDSIRPGEQVAAAIWTVRAAESCHRGWQMAQRMRKSAFLAAGKDKSATYLGTHGCGQAVDMPADRLLSLQMSGDARAQAARAIGRAAIEVTAGAQLLRYAADRDGERSCECDREYIGSGNDGNVLSSAQQAGVARQSQNASILPPIAGSFASVCRVHGPAGRICAVHDEPSVA